MNGAPVEKDWKLIAAELEPMRVDTKASRLRRFSQDYYWFSPVLREDLDGVIADLLVTPADEAELLRLMAYCARNRIGLTPRGAGTGNYGQAMPIEGGIVVDLRKLNTIEVRDNGTIRAGAGATLRNMERAALEKGWELRFFPSTWDVATAGGFVAGGTGGTGSINYGTLHDTGNLLSLKIATMEAEPRVIELRGADLPKAIHAYGTTGLILEVEMALAPAQTWHDFAVSFPTLPQALEAARQLAAASGIEKKQLSTLAPDVACYLPAFKSVLDPTASLLMSIVAENSIEPFIDLVEQAGGTVFYDRRTSELKVPPIYEYCFNHTNLQALTADKSLTYLQVYIPHDEPEDMILQFHERFAGEAGTHVEYLRLGGSVRRILLPLVHYKNRERLDELIEAYRSAGCMVRNPHSCTLDRGPGHRPAPLHRAYREETDPMGLLNPGKMPPAGPVTSEEMP